jgi:hypothetical protein
LAHEVGRGSGNIVRHLNGHAPCGSGDDSHGAGGALLRCHKENNNCGGMRVAP